MTTKVLNGKKLSQQLLKDLKKKAKDLNPQLGIVLVGRDSASSSFVKQKKKACEKIEIGCEVFNFSSEVDNSKLKKEVRKIAKDSKIDGLIIQLPLPSHIETDQILNLIPPEKDVDVLSSRSLGRFYQGSLEILPPIVGAVKTIFRKWEVSFKGKQIGLVGSGKLVGKPLAIWFLQNDATFSVINEFTEKPAAITRKADVLISGVGEADLISKEMVKKGAKMIDCGFSKVDNKIKGDADFESLVGKVSHITPVPGGVGPLVVAGVLKNLIRLKQV